MSYFHEWLHWGKPFWVEIADFSFFSFAYIQNGLSSLGWKFSYSSNVAWIKLYMRHLAYYWTQRSSWQWLTFSKIWISLTANQNYHHRRTHSNATHSIKKKDKPSRMLCYAKPRTDFRRIQSIIAKVTFHFTLKGIFLEKWEMFPDDVVLRSSDSVSKNKNHALHVKAHKVLTMFLVVAKTYSST